jgi:glycosyltransferase involved in cell wall biosynthesis
VTAPTENDAEDNAEQNAKGNGAAGGRERLRVLVVTVVHDPEDARIRHRQIQALLDAGAAVTYAAPFSARGRTPPPGVRAIDLPRARGRRRLGAVLAARRVIRAEADRQDVVLVHDPELLLALARARAGAPVQVWDVHEDTAAALGMRDWLPSPMRGPAAAAVRRLESWADRRCRLLLAEESYATRFAGHHPVVPNSVLVPEDTPPPPGDGRVVYLGRLTVPRGALELVELGRRLAGTIEVELIGPPDADCAAAVTEAHRRGWIRHHGFVPNTRARGMLDGALAGVSLLHDEPNYAHSRPTKIMEYMAHGLPVVSTPNPASEDLLARYGCGVLVPFGDVGAAADALVALRDDARRRRALGAAGRAAAVRDLDWRQDAARFTETLRQWSAARSR